MMTFALYTNCASEHQLPLAREIVARLGLKNFRYIFAGEGGQKFQQSAACEEWLVDLRNLSKVERVSWLEDVDALLVGGLRPIDLIERRLARGKLTFYMSERWFKPLVFGGVHLPGWLRLLHPGYFRMARRFSRLFGSAAYWFLPIGVWSARDMDFLCRLIGPASVEIDRSGHILPWGDFVAKGCRTPRPTGGMVKILSIGRFLRLKHVDTVIRAVRTLPIDRFELTIQGEGEELGRLQRLAHGAANIRFRPPVSLEGVRHVMREHDVLVMSSDALEGWGCVVNEAMEEGLTVVGTREAGASATMLPPGNLFRCGDWRSLARLLATDVERVPIGEWAVERAAERLLGAAREFYGII